jgi:hypothetical protein
VGSTNFWVGASYGSRRVASDFSSSGHCVQGMEAEIVWFSIVIFTALGMPMVQLDDKRGPYPNLEICYHRGAVMIKDVVMAGKFPPIIQFQVLCVDSSRPLEKDA